MPRYREHSSARWLWLLLGLGLLWPGHQASAQGGPRLMLNLLPIQGSSVVSGYEHWIEVENFSWAASKPVTFTSGGGVSTNPPTFDDILLTKVQDLSSSNLMYYCAHGLVVTQATLVGAVVGQYSGRSSTFFKLELRNAYISFVQVEADTSGDPMIEQVGLNFAGKFVWTYSQFSTNGPSLKFDDNYSSAYDKMSKVAGTLVPFNLSGQLGTGVVRINWVSSPLAIYDILRATSPAGPFSPYTTITNASGTNMMTLDVTNTAGMNFFYNVRGRF